MLRDNFYHLEQHHLAFSSAEKDRNEILYCIERAMHNINLWGEKHQLKMLNQDNFKQNLLSLLGDDSVLITLEWATNNCDMTYVTLIIKLSSVKNTHQLRHP